MPWITAVAIGLCIVWLFAMRRGETSVTLPARPALAVAAFFGVQILSSLRAVNPAEGMEQISRDLSAAAVFFLVAAGPFPSELVLRIIPAAFSISAGLVGLVGAAQRVGLHLPWLAPQELIISTLANPNYGGTFMALTIPMTLGLLSADRTLRVPLAFSLAFQALYSFLSGSRAGWLGIVVGLAFFAVLSIRRGTITRRHVLIGVLVVFSGLGLWMAVDRRPVSDRGARLTLQDWTVRVRAGMWSRTIQAIPESPLVGQGGTNFKHWYGRHRSDEELRLHSANLHPRTIPDMDNCHNGHLEIAVDSGLVGLALWGAALVLLFRHRSKNLDAVRIGAVCAGIAFLVSNFFNTLQFQSSHWTLFWAAAGMLVWKPAEAEPARPRWIWIPLILFCLVQAFLLSQQVRHVFAFEAYRRSFHSRDAAEVVGLLSRAVELHPRSVVLRHELGTVYIKIRRPDLARGEFEAILKHNPETPMAQFGVAICILGSDPQKGEALLRSLTEELPGWPWPWERLGSLELTRKKFDSALACFDRAVELRPDYGEGHAKRGVALARLNRIPEAVEAFRKSAEGKYAFPPPQLPEADIRELRAVPELAPFFVR